MSRELVRLDVKDREFVHKQIPWLADHYLTNLDKVALAIVDFSKNDIEQLWLFTLTEKLSHGEGHYGIVDDATIEIFNLLCSTCSSRSPEVTQHTLKIKTNRKDDVLAALQRSRLGKFSILIEDSKLDNEHTHVELVVEYPSV